MNQHPAEVAVKAFHEFGAAAFKASGLLERWKQELLERRRIIDAKDLRRQRHRRKTRAVHFLYE